MNGSIIISIAAMVLVLIGMLIVKKTMAASPMLQPLLFLCVALELGLVIFVFYRQLNGPSYSGRLEKQKRIYYSKGYVAGEAIKSAGSGKLLLILGSGAKADLSLQELVKGLEKTRGGSIVVEEIASSNTEEIQEITADMVNAVIKQHPDAEIIAMIGTLPYNYGSVSFGKAKIFLFDSGSTELKRLKRDIESEKIIGIMMSVKNPPKPAEELEKTEKEIFNKRFFIINKGNIAANAEYFK